MRARPGNGNGAHAVRGADRVRMSGEGNPRSRRRFDRRFHVLVGRVLRDLRHDKQWSLTQAGVAGGFYATNLIKHERGSRPLSLATLRSYLEAYGVTWELFGEQLHRLDSIRPSNLDPAYLNGLRREREAKGLNIFTGRTVTAKRMDQPSMSTTNRPAQPGVATLHVWCRKWLRYAPIMRWPALTTRSEA
jgi:hypothetical protein